MYQQKRLPRRASVRCRTRIKQPRAYARGCFVVYVQRWSGMRMPITSPTGREKTTAGFLGRRYRVADALHDGPLDRRGREDEHQPFSG